MTRLAKLDAAVVGAGVFGLSCALALVRAGARVAVFDPRTHNNASGIAAGMLAPYSERLLDPLTGSAGAALAAAYTLWPDFARDAGLTVAREGVVHLADPETLAGRLRQLASWGVAARLLSATELGSRLPGVHAGRALWSPDEARLDAGEALLALERAVVAAGGRLCPQSVTSIGEGGFAVAGRPLRADLVVVAAGDGAAALTPCAPELAPLAPIKGQLLRLNAGPHSGPTVRAPGGYLVPQASGVLVGATMVAGATDLIPDRQAAASLREAAAAVWPHLVDATGEDAVGVRMSAPDGGPIVGWSSRPGVLIAAGARRNGWLLAPLVARMVAAYAAGEDPGPFASAFSPDRFAGPSR